MINALSSVYETVCSVNLNDGTFLAHRLSPRLRERAGQDFSRGVYEEGLRFYLELEVFPENRALFERIATILACKELFAAGNSYSFEFRTAYDNEVHYYEAQLVHPDERSDRFVFALRNIDAEARNRMTMKEAAARQLGIIGALSQEYYTVWYIHGESMKMNLIMRSTEANVIQETVDKGPLYCSCGGISGSSPAGSNKLLIDATKPV